MRIIVVSDTHRRFNQFYDIVMKHKNEAFIFIHLGDGQKEIEDMLDLFPDLNLVSVRGNCDFASLDPETRVVFAGEERILCTHGHSLSVKYSLERLKQKAKEENCRIALYGHTHKSDTRYEDGIYILNPGSPTEPRDYTPSYGIIDIEKNGILPFIVKIK